MQKLRLSTVYALLFLTACNAAVPAGTPVAATALPTSTLATSPSAAKPDPSVEEIAIFSPASGSIVASPISIQGEADSTFEQNLVISLTDQDGNQLALKPTTINAPLGERGSYNALLEFSVSSQQIGRISVYSVSAMTGGLEHLNSVEVQLLPNGTASINSNVDVEESIAILDPQPLAVVKGGSLNVSGTSDYYFESSLGLVLCGGGASGVADAICGTADNVIASGGAIINSPDIGQGGPFSGNLTYTITAKTMGRIVLFATSPRDGGIIHLNSIAVEIGP